MQDTRLNTLIARSAAQLGNWLQNPWRRWSMLIISLLLGNFLASVVSTVAGQEASLDIVVAAILVAIAELISRFVYRSPAGSARVILVVPNALKIGLTYGLFVEAFKLGS